MAIIERGLAPAGQAEEVELDDLDTAGISLGQTLSIAMGALLANKLRTLLTALGVIIGVTAVVALMAIGQGVQDSITASITANGANLLTVRGGPVQSGAVRGQIGQGQTLSMRDATLLQNPESVPSALYVSPEFFTNGQLVAGAQNLNARVTGAVATYLPLHNLGLAEGEFLNDGHVSGRANVVVLGANVAKILFGDQSAVGQSIKISGIGFQVIGTLTAKGGNDAGSMDDGVIVPLSTAQQKLGGTRAISGGTYIVTAIVVQARDTDSVDAAMAEIQQVLRTQHNLPLDGSADDFGVINQQDILNSAVQTTQVLTLFLGAIAAISLLVGGIGIMNIMLVSVRERTREIGLRKAIGARERDILLQFIVEALALSLGGGLLGLLLGNMIALGVNQSGLISATVSPGSVLLAVGFSSAVGLFFGIEPARRAARLDPIEALRFD